MTLWDEILEQVHTVDQAVLHSEDAASRVAAQWRDREVAHVVIAARGTSDNAARYAQYVWGVRNRISVGLAAPSLHSVYGSPPSFGSAAVVGISQSGQSPDIVAVLSEAKRQSRPTLAITNDHASPLALAADHVLLLNTGPEHAIAATKTYTAELAVVATLSEALSGGDDTGRALHKLTSGIESMVDQSHAVAAMATEMAAIDQCAVVGRGFNHATVFEWALKLQELTYVLAQPFSTADFLHGPVALVEPGFPILAIAPSGPTHEDVHALLVDLVERSAPLVVISDVTETLALTGSAIRLPHDVPEWLTPIVAIVGAQLFAYHLTVAKGLDPERPRGLSKVTRTV